MFLPWILPVRFALVLAAGLLAAASASNAQDKSAVLPPTVAAATSSLPDDKPSLDKAVQDLKTDGAEARKAACMWLARTPPADVTRALDALLDDAADDVREAAALAEVAWADRDSVPALIKAMQKPNSTIWQPCVDALVRLQDKRAVVPLVLQTQNIHHKESALKALVAMGSVVETALDEIVADPTAVVMDRVAACRLLAEPGIGTPRSVPALLAAAEDDDPKILQVVTQVLPIIKKRP